MRNAVRSLALGLALVAGSAAAQDMVLAGGTLVDPATGNITRDAVVVVRGGKVAEIRSGGNVPAGLPVVDAKGKWIVPGYIDGHVHFHQSGGLYTRPDAIDLRAVRPFADEVAMLRADLDDTFARYLASGVTAVADVGGPTWNFTVRERAAADPRAPHVAVAGPLISTWKPPIISDVEDPAIIAAATPDEARALVRAQVPRKTDFIKIWFVVNEGETPAQHLPVVEAAIAEAHAAGLRVAVHATELETARAALTAGADILVHGIEDAPIDADFIALLKRRGAIYTTTIDVVEGYWRSFTGRNAFTEREFALADPEVMGTLLDLKAIPADKMPDFLPAMVGKPIPTKGTEMLQANLIRVRDAGVPIAMGTDAGNIGTLPGPSIYREFARMAAAGMTPREILASATVGAARLMGRSDTLGRIAPGRPADMVVLDADPLADSANLSRIALVVRGGRGYRQADLVPQTPAEVVQRQLNAYNAHDLEAFLATYAPDARLYDWPDKTTTTGIAAMRETYAPLFQRFPDLHAAIASRIVIGDKVIDDERLSGLPVTPGPRAAAIYEVKGGKIASVGFIEDPSPPPAPAPQP